MSELPERIWLTNFVKDQYGARLGRGAVSDLDHGSEYPEYRRADLPPSEADILAHPKVRGLVEALVEHATHRKDGKPYNPSMSKVYAALATLHEPPE